MNNQTAKKYSFVSSALPVDTFERFWIEQGYQQLKEDLGLDHHEGRSWIGWRRHVLLVILAFGYLTHQTADIPPFLAVSLGRLVPPA